MRSISFASSALLVVVSIAASTVACVGSEEKPGTDPAALGNGPSDDSSSPNEGTSDTDLGVTADLKACGDIDAKLIAGLSCSVYAGADLLAKCDVDHLGLCAYADCALDCTADAKASCKAECGLDCTADCTANLDLDAAVSCEASCAVDVAAACLLSYKSKGYKSQVDCEAALAATCEAECHVCADIDASASCAVKCNAACDASCHAKANLDCQLGCQADLHAQLKASCEAALEAEGALFCDDAYISAVVDAKACVKALVDIN